MHPPADLLKAMTLPNAKELHELGTKIGQLYTDHGLPIDMSLDRLEYTKQEKVNILVGAQHWLVQHRKNSNATDKALERQRKANRESLERFIKTGESGIY